MKNWKRIWAALLALSLALSLCACNSGGAPADSPSPDPSAEVPGDPDLDPDASASPEIVADLSQDILAFSAGMSADDQLLTVNGAAVPADLVLYWLASNCFYFQTSYGIYGLPLESYAPMLLEDTVSMSSYYTLLRQKAAELGCLPTDAQVQQARDDMLSEGEDTYELRKSLYGITDDTMEYIYTIDAYYDNLLAALVPEATEEMINGYVYHVKHILLLTVDMEGQPSIQDDGSYAYPPLDEDTIAEKRAQAEDLLAQLRASSDPEALFDQLMNEYSEDSGLADYPDGYTAVPGDMVPAFEEASFALGFGEVSDIVESSYGYHIILRLPVDDLGSYADECREQLLEGELASLMEAADIVRAPELDALDVSDFYERYSAYQQALLDQQPDGGGDGSEG